MAKKKIKKDSMCLLKKGVTLAASVLVFIFMFLELLAVKSKEVCLAKKVMLRLKV